MIRTHVCAVKKLRLMEDAYGQEVWSYFNGNRSDEIVEREDGYFDVSSGAPSYFSFLSYLLNLSRSQPTSNLNVAICLDV